MRLRAGETPHHKQQEKAQKVYKVNSMPLIDSIKRFLFLNLLFVIDIITVMSISIIN